MAFIDGENLTIRTGVREHDRTEFFK